MDDLQLQLQTPVTATSTFTSVALDLGNGFAPNEGGMPVHGNLSVTAANTTTGTYVAKMQESSDNATFTDITPPVPITGPGAFYCKGFVAKEFVRLVVTIAVVSGTPSITYSAFLNPIVNR